MSQHIFADETARFIFVFGWDQPLRSFFFQKHDLSLNEDTRITVWLGATKDTSMPEVHHLDDAARKNGFKIPYETVVKLYREKDDGI